MARKKQNVFERIPEFLAAYRRIAVEGFFERLEVRAGNHLTEGRVDLLYIDGSGCIPNNRRYAVEGCGALVDPEQIIAEVRRLGERRIKKLTVEVKTEDWERFDRSGEKVIGSKGSRTTFSLIIKFKVKA